MGPSLLRGVRILHEKLGWNKKKFSKLKCMLQPGAKYVVKSSLLLDS